MRWFGKNKNPLDRQLAELDREMRRLDAQVRSLKRSPHRASAPPPPYHPPSPPPQPAAMPHEPLPGSHVEPAPDLGLEREHDLWTHRASLEAQRRGQVEPRGGLKALWRSLFGPPPAPSDPRLVSYLSTGSFKTVRPLRYERRVARNRFLFSLALLMGTLTLLLLALKNC